MQNTVNERIRIIIKSELITMKELSEMTGFAQGTLSNMFSRGTNPSFEMIMKIAENFPSYSMDWLVTGKGSMLKDGINTHINGAGNSVRNFSNVNVANNSSERITVGENNSVLSNDNQKNEIEALRQTNKEQLKEIEYLKNALTDKERLIQVLMNNLTNK